jgi:hypothetical protein
MAQDASEGLWQSLLREVTCMARKSNSAISKAHQNPLSFVCAQAMRKKRVPDSTIIVVGAKKCGKRTLLAHLQTSGAADSSNTDSQTDNSK